METLDSKRVWTIHELSAYSGFQKSYLYKLTMANRIPGVSRPTGKVLLFDSRKVIEWLLSNPQKTAAEIDAEASNYTAESL